MNFAFTEEQEELRKTVRQFLEAKSPETAVREQMETEAGYDAAVWSQMGEQMGLQGLDRPRGVRRFGLQLRRARHRARGDGPRACCAPRSSRPSCWPPTP
jgi:alkylation response protein AidB-like acyl-CoA dehydrogenase